ncbi:MAG: ribosomal RNA small subunit methyltransferase A [Bdellovibrionaceae bacterium]|nr:ribosomal RNA small subunit methyltransferase A [Pseudobdellovibrionaceae bacterium]
MTARERLEIVLRETGHAAKRSLGQNFLISDTVIERIHEEARSLQPEFLIEIGPGPGALTDGLREMNLPMKVIELDRTMAEYWRGKNLEVIEEDALRVNWVELIQGNSTVLVSNLPYQISSSLVIDRSLDDRTLSGMVLMFQKEVAQRIRALPSTEAYGMLSVIAQNFWSVRTVSDAGPRDFDPPPRVASRVLGFRPLADVLKQKKQFLAFVKACFAQRRKLLKSNLSGWMGSRKIPLENLLAKLDAFGLKETARAEELSPAQFRELYEHLDRSGK